MTCRMTNIVSKKHDKEIKRISLSCFLLWRDREMKAAREVKRDFRRPPPLERPPSECLAEAA